MSGFVVRGGHFKGEDSRKKKCKSCKVTGGGWSKQVTNGKTVWVHECGAEQ